MSKTIYYQQCTLRKQDGKAHKVIVSWIPTEYAILNKQLRLQDDDGEWTFGWIVVQVGKQKLSNLEVPDHRKAVRSHRKNTGDSNPKNTRDNIK